ncbi:MAG: S-layer homology domain-containing protein [Thermomicrobiales bacterium]
MAAATPPFSDVDPHSTSPYATAIYALAQRGILNGYNDGTGRFGPLDPTLRAQAAVVVVRALGWTGNQGHTSFADQGTGDSELWNSVRVLADRGVAQGFGDGTYRPNLPVSQVQAVSLITRAMVNKGYWVNQPDADTLYPDVPASSGARTDLATYTFYAGAVPFATSTAAGGWTNWSQPANRQGVALVTWNALQSRGHKTSPPTPTSAPPTPTRTTTPPPPTPTTSPAPGGAIVYAAGAPWATQPPQAGSPAPVAGQQCPAWVHDRYAAQAPDGLWYPTWHPPVDPQYGCWFGHDHGDNPAGSAALHGRPVLYGYSAHAMSMAEAHEGFKVYRWDPHTAVQNPTSSTTASAVMVIHQGTSGAKRFTATMHSVEFHYLNPADGREVHVDVMAPFGTLAVGCGANDPNLVTVKQAQMPGTRQVAGAQCFGAARYPDTNGVIPGSIPYEDWLTALYIGADANGNWAAYINPHFAVFNPNTYCVPTSTFSTPQSTTPCTLAYSDDRAGDGVTPSSTASDYKGTHREAYLTSVWLANAGKATTIWTDAMGKRVPAGTPGAIAQYVSAVNQAPQDGSNAFDGNVDYDQGGIVHAPN